MRIRAHLQSVHRFTPTARSLILSLRLTPRGHDGQHVANWRIDLDADARLRPFQDAFGNVAHQVTLDGPIESLTITVSGEVETWDTAGVVRGAVEPLPLMTYLRETEATRADDALRRFADDVAANARDDLDAMHRLMRAVHEAIAIDEDPARQHVDAATALAAGTGAAVDAAHVFVAAARHLGRPSRVAAGCRAGEAPLAGAFGPVWAESHVDGYGWIGFDPTRDLCPSADVIRVATGFDALGASPMRGGRYGASVETLDIRAIVTAS